MKRSPRYEEGRRWRKAHPLYAVHMGMLQRCGQKNGCRSASNLRRYRDRGIRVCDEWRSLPKFEEWAMAHGWRRGLQIDRIDPDGNYEPNNCRFITPRQNTWRRVNSLMVEVDGRSMCLAQAVAEYGRGLKYKTIYCRLKRGKQG